MKPSAPPRLTRAVLILLSVCVVAGLVGAAFSPVLLVKNPLLLLALSPDVRHVALAAGSVSPGALIVVTVLRRALFSLGSYGLGYVYGDAAVSWVEQRHARTGELLRRLERVFARFGAPILVLAPLASVCILAGAARTRFAAFLPAVLVGQVIWVGSSYALGTLISDLTAQLIAFLADHLLESTLVCVALVAGFQLLSRRRAARRTRTSV